MISAYILAGGFLIGVGLSGLISYSAYIIPELRLWGFWLSLVGASCIVIAALLDDYLARWLGLDYQGFIFLIISLSFCLLIGGLIQWI